MRLSTLDTQPGDGRPPHFPLEVPRCARSERPPDAGAEQGKKLRDCLDRLAELLQTSGQDLQAMLRGSDDERTLLRLMAALLSKTVERLRINRQLRETVQQFQGDRASLEQANAALRSFFDNLEDERNQLRSSIAASVDKIVMPLEIGICRMIRDNLSTKEIAKIRHVAPATVARQREQIRRKLGITGSDANLTTFLRAYME